jgi:hypothetical protein
VRSQINVGTYGTQPMGKELTLEAVGIRVERQPRFSEIIHIFLTTCECRLSAIYDSGDSIINR